MIIDAKTLSLAQQQAMFFRDPLEEPILPGTFGSLYLLRRDLNDMRKLAPNEALWPRAMVIFAGIDLLAKFWENNDMSYGEIGKRFRRFVAHFMTKDNSESSDQNYAFWNCRNSVLHSFGWYSEGGGKVYRFTLTRDLGNWLIQQDSTNLELWSLNLVQLEKLFEDAISAFEKAINDPAQPETFPAGNKIFEKYGWSNIGSTN